MVENKLYLFDGDSNLIQFVAYLSLFLLFCEFTGAVVFRQDS